MALLSVKGNRVLLRMRPLRFKIGWYFAAGSYVPGPGKKFRGFAKSSLRDRLNGYDDFFRDPIVDYSALCFDYKLGVSSKKFDLLPK
jgi:hypothetical protein